MALALDYNAERRVMAFWHSLATTRFSPLELVWLDLFTSFRGLKPFLQAFTLLSPPGPNKTSIRLKNYIKYIIEHMR